MPADGTLTAISPPQPGALHLGFSQDHFNFTVLREPLILVDGGGWARPNPSELLGYPSLLDAHTGSNQLSRNQWNLFYMDLQPNESFDKRYLVARPIDVSRSRQGDDPQVGILFLTRICWRPPPRSTSLNSSLSDREEPVQPD